MKEECWKKIVLQDTQGVLLDSECSGFSCVAIQWDWIGGCVTIQILYCDSGLGMLARSVTPFIMETSTQDPNTTIGYYKVYSLAYS